jgi:16S rRNA G966 N2-methylase RsmD
MGTTEKKDFLFRFVPPNLRHDIKLDHEALYSTTDQVTADKITRELLKYVPRNSTVTDATACIGGSTYSLAQSYSNVIAIENDDQRYNFLKHNIKILKESNSNIQYIECIKGDAVIECTKQFQDAIFIDPPWGGPEYKILPSVQLYLSGLPLSEVCKKLSRYTNFIVLKVPINFDEKTFLLETDTFLELKHKNSQLRKMQLLIFETLLIKT